MRVRMSWLYYLLQRLSLRLEELALKCIFLEAGNSGPQIRMMNVGIEKLFKLNRVRYFIRFRNVGCCRAGDTIFLGCFSGWIAFLMHERSLSLRTRSSFLWAIRLLLVSVCGRMDGGMSRCQSNESDRSTGRGFEWELWKFEDLRWMWDWCEKIDIHWYVIWMVPKICHYPNYINEKGTVYWTVYSGAYTVVRIQWRLVLCGSPA